MARWVGALVGYLLFRLPGALLGFFLGSLIDSMGRKEGSVFQDFGRARVSPQDFELHLISLCSIVIKADGKVTQQELDYVRRYFLSTYGREKANAIFRTFNEVVKKREVSAEKICSHLAQRTRYEVRLQLVHFLFGIAGADGRVSPAEVEKLLEIARYLRIGPRDFESIKAMFFESADTAYTILEIERTATDEEVKKAYRNMAKKYHPDRVNTQDEAIRKGAEEKFKQVQKAYEQIQRDRGL
ncbi:TerB family tellurite resistance protein [Robiginitalea marina]|uniref:Molecular chaperone DjiA n=1 Tax=Robiginitalea marina TaxID=2954105 RepID=A0ABT1AWA8_9FLAO|nr:TerB family tellurite resistance protein [Robiginitalea marina]MCO5724339.1 molecular chaperone DjiA [Robiginitalea marina]